MERKYLFVDRETGEVLDSTDDIEVIQKKKKKPKSKPRTKDYGFFFWVFYRPSDERYYPPRFWARIDTFAAFGATPAGRWGSVQEQSPPLAPESGYPNAEQHDLSWPEPSPQMVQPGCFARVRRRVSGQPLPHAAGAN